jgi:hypothetical protein
VLPVGNIFIYYYILFIIIIATVLKETETSSEKGKWSGRPKVIEDAVENMRDHLDLEEHPRTSLTRLSLQTDVPRSTYHKIVQGELAFTSIQSNNCTRPPP